MMAWDACNRFVSRIRMRSLRAGQIGITTLLFGGYAALYFCRADLSVGTPLIIEQLGQHGVSHSDARLTLSIAWAGLVKVSSKWFDYSSYGMIMGILSISYLIGDAAATQ